MEAILVGKFCDRCTLNLSSFYMHFIGTDPSSDGKEQHSLGFIIPVDGVVILQGNCTSLSIYIVIKAIRPRIRSLNGPECSEPASVDT